MWKAGQIVTIEGKKYRIKRHYPDDWKQCAKCAFLKAPFYGVCSNLCIFDASKKVPKDCYFELIPPKRITSKQEIKRTLKNDGFIPLDA